LQLQRKLEGYQKRLRDLETTLEKNAGLLDKPEAENEQEASTSQAVSFEICCIYG